MGHEENFDGAGVEADNQAPDNQQPLVVDAVVAEEPRPTHAQNAPDFYAVGVRLIKMSPVWLLTAAGGFALLILVLSWIRPAGGEADAASIPNDAKSVAVQQYSQAPAAPAPSAETRAPEATQAAPATPAARESEPAQESKPAEQPKEQVKVATPANDAGGKFTVQVGSFNAESQANERISSLRAAGFDARSAAAEIPGRGKWYRVQVGRFREREEAAKAAGQLREKGAAASALVVPVQD